MADQSIFYFRGSVLNLAELTDILDGNSVSGLDKLKYALGNLLVYGPLKNTLGFSRVRIGYTAGEAIVGDVEGLEPSKVSQLRWQLASELIEAQVQVRQRGSRTKLGRNGSTKEIVT